MGHPTGCPIFYLSHWMSHPLSADEVQMHVKYGLSAMRTGIDDDAITALMNIFLHRDLTSHHEHMADQWLIFNL